MNTRLSPRTVALTRAHRRAEAREVLRGATRATRSRYPNLGQRPGVLAVVGPPTEAWFDALACWVRTGRERDRVEADHLGERALVVWDQAHQARRTGTRQLALHRS